ncbi:hypothetical protein B0H14DRAFT_3453423 [Mycena olivaceomarginata]|nr:hypothetical protein B0H14DRAFT_3453423 [Mycena olivaceomarginata]
MRPLPSVHSPPSTPTNSATGDALRVRDTLRAAYSIAMPSPSRKTASHNALAAEKNQLRNLLKAAGLYAKKNKRKRTYTTGKACLMTSTEMAKALLDALQKKLMVELHSELKKNIFPGIKKAMDEAEKAVKAKAKAKAAKAAAKRAEHEAKAEAKAAAKAKKAVEAAKLRRPLQGHETVASLGLMVKDPTFYGARTCLISGSCKQESGERHSKILKTVLDASAVTKLRTNWICSDGEARRAEAMIRLTFKFSLAPSSPIYPLLHGLEFLNLMVGEDDLTGDKDYKHYFRLRNWLLRKRGLVIGDLEIRSQLQFDGLAPIRIGNPLQLNDHQDVKLVFDLLREVWRLPSLDSESGKPVRFIETRETFQMLGSLFRHLIFSYICTSLSLSDQLRHLSAAAHLLLALMRMTNAGAKFMPTQLYINPMLMIKNTAWRCYLEFCEPWLGATPMLIFSSSPHCWNHRSLDNSHIIPALGHRSSPPKATCSLENDIEIEQKQDHITPWSWTGDVAVKNGNLHTAWIMGRKNIEGEFPALAPVLKELSDKTHSGRILRMPNGVDDSAEDYQEAGVVPSTSKSDPSPEPFTEDAVAEDDPEQKYSLTFALGGKEVYKGR